MGKPSEPSLNGLEELAQPHYLGHRERARQRFLQLGEQHIEDYELMELVLQIVIPRKDTKPLAKQLIETFGSFSAVFGASPSRLDEIKGMGLISATNLKIIQAIKDRLQTVVDKSAQPDAALTAMAADVTKLLPK